MARGDRKPGESRMVPWLYDLVLWVFSVLVDLFFREVAPRGAWKVPKQGPVILVAAPHANQFVDSLILMRILKHEAHRRISYLIAAKSTKRAFIGTMSTALGSIPVARALDQVGNADGMIFLPDQHNNPALLQGVDTKFTSPKFQVGGLIVLPKIGNQTPSSEIAEIISDTELRLKKPFKSSEAVDMLTQDYQGSRGTRFKVAPYVDQSKVYNEVFDELAKGGCVGIFPEGGSHDRPDLLPLKAGVAIMALGALAKNPACGLKIIPIGMNYFHANKFRSRAVIEFGHPIEVHPEQVEAYKTGDRRNAVGSLLETVYQGLLAVTQSSPDYDTLMLAQAARRLYNPHGKKLPLPLVVDLNRRLIKGYTAFQDDPRVIEVKKDVNEYNRRLKALGIKDHQVEWGNVRQRRWWYTFGVLVYRVSELIFLFLLTLPGLVMFWPVFVITKYFSVKKSREALAASTVKLEGRDVIATWKLLCAMVVAPALYIYYDVIVCLWLSYNRRGGHYTSVVPWYIRASTYVPDFIPVWAFAIYSFLLYIMITMAALRIGEVGMDVLKSLPPLFIALNPRSSSTLTRLRERRENLAAKVTQLINELGPQVFPDFDADKIVADTYREGAYQSHLKRMPDTPVPEIDEPSSPPALESEEEHDPPPRTPPAKSFGTLPRNESFGNIGAFGFFASRPHTPKSRSRSSSTGGALRGSSLQMKAFTSVDSKESADEVSKRIRTAMRERGRKRESEGDLTESSWDMADNDSDEDSKKTK